VTVDFNHPLAGPGRALFRPGDRSSVDGRRVGAAARVCAGVDRAIEIVERALEQFGAPVYVRHEIVSQHARGGDLRAKGAVFVGRTRGRAGRRDRHFFGPWRGQRQFSAKRGHAACACSMPPGPLVTKVHVEVAKMRAQGREIVMIGHRGHPEVEGTMGQFEEGGAGGMYLVERSPTSRACR